MNILETVAKHDLKIHGVIQVGSHHGEEIPIWDQLKLQQVHFEPVRSNYAKMLAGFPGITLYPVALGSRYQLMDMYCESVNGGQSCSLLRPKDHLQILPWIEFNSRETVIVCPLDDFGVTHCNLLYIDAQGYELDVLMGGLYTLKFVDYIITEVNRAEVFENCSRVEAMDSFLSGYGFRRVETDWHGGEFGDALFIR